MSNNNLIQGFNENETCAERKMREIHDEKMREFFNSLPPSEMEESEKANTDE